MASSRPNSSRDGGRSGPGTEPFPTIPESSAIDANPPATTTTTTYTTSTSTTTVIPPSGRSYTITSSQPSTSQTTTQPSSSAYLAIPNTRTLVSSVDPANARPVDGGPIALTTSRTSAQPPTIIRTRPIGIRRLPSANLRQESNNRDSVASNVSRSSSGRGRSTSAPQPVHLAVPGQGQGQGQSSGLTRQNTRQSLLPTVAEDARAQAQGVDRETMAETTGAGSGRRRSVSNAARSIMSRISDTSADQQPHQEYEPQVADMLDVLDTEVATLNTLNNVQNSLFVPDLGRWLNRRPTYDLSSRRSTYSRRPETIAEKETPGMTPIQSQPTPEERPEEPIGETPSLQRTWSWQRKPQMERSHSISSVVTDSHFAVLPHGVSLEGWSDEDKADLDDHVRHMMHSRRSKFKQRMVAFGKYIRKPLGFLVTLYATLITLFGLAWVLFLIGWISVGDRQLYIVNVIDNVLVALFALVGDGLAPFRVVDTYHMIYIAHYHQLSWRLRKEKNLPKLHDHNDLPVQTEKEADPEAGTPEDTEFSVLTLEQQRKLIHHQAKFTKSHSFYKPHETATHYAFPLRLLIAIVVLLDFHSIFQIALGTCTWAIDYRTRPEALTAVILTCSITVNITAGILISVGDRKTRKKDVAERMTRQALTQSAIKKVEKHKKERAEQLNGAGNHDNFEVIQEETEDSRQSGSRS